ncbi:hypothetical protein DFH09DRAFT_1071420 [Mycena vulgaris]|nr:hypothetical protein DFH09DRAFT_1071420 [Mycena vulgaris]
MSYALRIGQRESVVDWYISDHLGRVNGRVPRLPSYSLIRMFAAGRSAKYMFETAQNLFQRCKPDGNYKLLGPDEFRVLRYFCPSHDLHQEAEPFFMVGACLLHLRWVKGGPMRAEEVWEEGAEQRK